MLYDYFDGFKSKLYKQTNEKKMNINLKLFTVSIICLVATACTTSTTTSKRIEGKEKAQWINVYQLSENITISSTDSRKLDDFKVVQIKTNNFGVNKILINALDHHLLDQDDEFSGDVVPNATIGKNSESSDLKPLLIPSITMSDDYRVITVELIAKTDQSQRVYLSKKIVANGTPSENKQYAINNPIPLKEKVINALYDVAEQYANDYNQ